MSKHTGKYIAIIGFIGGASVIRSLMSHEVRTGFLITGCILILVSVALFIKQIKKI